MTIGTHIDQRPRLALSEWLGQILYMDKAGKRDRGRHAPHSAGLCRYCWECDPWLSCTLPFVICQLTGCTTWRIERPGRPLEQEQGTSRSIIGPRLLAWRKDKRGETANGIYAHVTYSTAP